MPLAILIGVLAGAASALLLATGAGGGLLLSGLLFLVAPLPALLAGIGWGPRAVIASTIAGCLVAVGLGGVRLGLTDLATIGLPVPLLCWLGHLRRAVPTPPQVQPTRPGMGPRLEWYPIGHLIAWTAVIAGLVALATIIVLGGDIDAVRASAREIVERQAQSFSELGARGLTGPEKDAIAAIFVRLLPAATASSWMVMIVFNLWLAGRILRTSGRLARPWPRLAALTLPVQVAPLLAVALALSFGSSGIALVASGFASALLTAYAFVGLAVLHWITYGRSLRPLVLMAAYIAAVVLAPYGTVPIALIGLLETILRLRGRSEGPPDLGRPRPTS